MESRMDGKKYKKIKHEYTLINKKVMYVCKSKSCNKATGIFNNNNN